MSYSDYTFSNVIILFGALQGFLLIIFLSKKKEGNRLAYWFFALFLFSLAYVNLWYGLYFMGIHYIGELPIIASSYPYEFLIGAGFYFYIKTQKGLKLPFHKREFFLFGPAIIYSLLQLYWYITQVEKGDLRFYRELEDSGFYTIVEYIRFIFNIILAVYVIWYLSIVRHQNKWSPKEHKNLQWLLQFSNFFLGYNILSMILTSAIFIPNIYNLEFFYITFFTNTIFIYWIGYIGYTKPNILFSNSMVSIKKMKEDKYKVIQEKLIQIMEVEEQFLHSDFSLSKLALLSKISGKELSDYINNIHKCNVSEYINKFRVDKVKALLDSSDFNHYTLEAISKEAGFKSKSSFNSIFKKHTALSPSQYKKREK